MIKELVARGGIIGMELGQVYAALGTRVSVVASWHCSQAQEGEQVQEKGGEEEEQEID